MHALYHLSQAASVPRGRNPSGRSSVPQGAGPSQDLSHAHVQVSTAGAAPTLGSMLSIG